MSTLYCRHIRPSGRRCQSPALSGQPLCFHHASASAHHRALHPPDDGTRNVLSISNSELEKIRREPMVAECYVNARGPVVLDFPTLEDADSVQLALSMVLTVLGQNRLEPKRAAAMLYTLQIAAANARNLSHNDSDVVREFIHDDSGAILAPNEDPEEVQESKLFLEELAQRRKDNDEQDPEDDEYDQY
jgi:hypothetical protein